MASSTLDMYMMILTYVICGIKLHDPGALGARVSSTGGYLVISTAGWTSQNKKSTGQPVQEDEDVEHVLYTSVTNTKVRCILWLLNIR